MRRLLFACVLAAGVPTATAQQQILTEGYFSMYAGDVTPLIPGVVFATAINGTRVTNLTGTVTHFGPDPNSTLDDVVMQQGTLDLPTHPTSVEFKTGQVFGTFVSYSTPNLIAWTPSDTTIPGGVDPFATSFKLGTLTITNGVFFYDATFELTLATVSSNPLWNNHLFTGVMHYVVTPNDGLTTECTAKGITDVDTCQADYVYLENHPNLGILDDNGNVVPSPRPGPIVFEAVSAHPNTGTVELWGHLGSLDPAYYAHALGGVGLPVAAAPVPETPAWLTMLAGSWGVATLLSRRRRRDAAAR